jgi:DNA-binding transcriptional regulator YdaS (Cro superfamily)
LIELTDRAEAAVNQALSAARRFNPDACIRLARAGAGGAVRFELIDEPDPADTSLSVGDATLFVEAGLDGVLDTGEHQAPVLLPRA